jgi:predicted Zn-dependent peptidase
VSGKFDKDISKMVAKYFPLKAIGQKPKYIPFKKKNKESRIIIDKRKTQQSHLRLATYGLKIEDDDRYAYSLLGLILGGSMSSRLFEEIREKRSLAYYINAYAESYLDCGYCLIKAGVNSGRLNEAVKAIRDEVRKSQEDITDEEVARAREMLKGSIAMEKEDSEELAWFYGFQSLLESRIRDYGEIIKKIDATDKNDIKRVARRLFGKEDMYLSLVGQGDEKELLRLIGG